MGSVACGLAFDLLSSDTEAVTTGHAEGVITLDLDETDPAHREQMRVQLGEPYRTVLGNLRHEVGHYDPADRDDAMTEHVAMLGSDPDPRPLVPPPPT